MTAGILLPVVLLAQVDTAWVRRYDGPAHSSDLAKCIAVDGSGNVVVAGDSRGTDSTWDWVIIKYGPVGDSLWAVRRNSGGNDFVRDLKLDMSGNVSVTGLRDGRAVTERYGPDGQVLWSTPYGSRDSVDLVGLQDVPDGGAVLCGGRLTVSWDALLVKYRSGGETAWVRTFDVDGSHNSAAGLAVNDAGEIYAVGSFLDNSAQREYCVALKSDSLGNELWTELLLDSADTDDEWLEQVVLDRDGNAVAAGASFGPSSGRDYLTIKYGPTGETLWTRRYNGPANDRDEARAVAVDSAGNVYVTGSAINIDTGEDFTTAKYRPDGSVAWLREYDSGVRSGDGAAAVAVGSDGRIYVTGSSYTPTTKADCATVCYDSLGDTVWVRRYNTPNNQWEYTSAIALTPAGAVCVAGRGGSTTTGYDILVIKYAPRGAVAEQETALPPGAARLTAIPNPCRMHVSVRWQARDANPTRISILDALGRPVRVLLEGGAPADGEILWDRTDAAGERLPAGVYFVELDTGGRSQRAKLLVID